MPIAIIAEDDDTVRSLMKAIANMQGYKVEEFSDPGAALQRIRDKSRPRPDLLITDNDMPQDDQGVELIRHLRSDEQAAALSPMAVVLISAKTVSDAHTDLIQEAAVNRAAFVRKSIAAANAIVQAMNEAHRLAGNSPGAGRSGGAGPTP